jgi:hypothetical protein
MNLKINPNTVVEESNADGYFQLAVSKSHQAGRPQNTRFDWNDNISVYLSRDRFDDTSYLSTANKTEPIDRDLVISKIHNLKHNATQHSATQHNTAQHSNYVVP